jgi:diadenylate cyclase
MVRHAHAIAREVSAKAVLLHADVVEEDSDLGDLIQDVDFRVILVSRKAQFEAPAGWGELCAVVRVPDIPMTRFGQVKIAVLVAGAEGLLQSGDRVVCLTGLDRSEAIDTVLVLDLGTEVEMFAGSAADILPCDVTPAVFERLLTIASELGLEGREGRPVGALFILGESDRVMSQSRQLVMNPFQGYPEEERNVLDPRLEETIKEFSAIDGAFLVRGDGVLLSAGRYLTPQEESRTCVPQGLGARHEAAAGITVGTNSIALCISQSTGTISIFKDGQLVTDIQKPRSRGHGDL